MGHTLKHGKEVEGAAHSHQDSSGSGNLHSSSTDGDGARPTTLVGEMPLGFLPPPRKFANPGPLGLSAFALTTFVLSLINIKARGLTKPNLVVSLAYGYGGLLQFISGMWEIVMGNTLAATAMASYGGFWIALAIILTPSFEIESALGANSPDYVNSMGFFLIGWFIFTTLILIGTFRSTLVLFMTIFFLDLTFFFLAVGYLHNDHGLPREGWIKAGGWAGIFTAFCAWYGALAGLLDRTNSFFVLPVWPFPWSVQGREQAAKRQREMA
ncbi:MAG: hypothetical protein M1815_005616 [Lichina confinis]|nr:MAG: hypothetical protein M1815_005616 [Lichina confinis]